MAQVPIPSDLWATGKPREHDDKRQLRFASNATLQPLVEVVDLFCGGGGFSTGAIAADAKVVLAIDNWQPALEIHHANHPNTKSLNLELGGSIPELAVFIREHLTPGAHFHLHGSPPCQALSQASASVDAEDGMLLVNWFIDLVHYMKPDSWSMENVVPVAKKLDKHRPGTPYVKLNSADFGVPQTRRRVFAGEGWTATPTHTKDEWVSVVEALPDLQEELQFFKEYIKVDTERFKWVSNTDGCSKSMSRRCQSVDTDVSKPVKTIHNNATTIRQIDSQEGKAIKLRPLTLDENKVLQGFPSTYKLPFTKKRDAWVIVGNAVCPPIAEAIIRGLK